jgi:hypothetical protein
MYVTEMFSDGVLYLPSFMRIGKDVQAILRFCLSNMNCCVLLTGVGGIYECAGEIGWGGMIYLLTSMQIGIGVQAILTFCLCNLKRSNVCDTDGRSLKLSR